MIGDIYLYYERMFNLSVSFKYYNSPLCNLNKIRFATSKEMCHSSNNSIKCAVSFIFALYYEFMTSNSYMYKLQYVNIVTNNLTIIYLGSEHLEMSER